MTLFHFRSIKNPFAGSFSILMTGTIVMIIYLISFSTSFPMFYYSTYKWYSGNHWKCNLNLGRGNARLVTAVKDALMTSFIPIPIIIFVQILSYRELTRSSNQFELGLNHIRRLKEVAKTFTKVTICFFLLTTPAVVYFVFVQYIGRYHRHLLRLHYTVFSTLPRCFNILVAVNSIINPFLYSKIQRRFSRKQANQRDVVIRMRKMNKSETETSIAISVVGDHKYKLSVN